MQRNTSQGDGKRYRAVVDLKVFNAYLLGDEVALEVAIGVLESYLEDPLVSIERLVGDLVIVPHLFEFMISVISESAAARLKDWVIKAFPQTAAGFLDSPAMTLLDQLSLYLLSLPYASSSDRPRNLQACRSSVELAQPVLRLLASNPFIPSDSALNSTAKMKCNAKGTAKQQRNHLKTVELDSKPFRDLGVDIPSNQDQADNLVKVLLGDQKDVLEYYLKILRNSDLRGLIRDAYIQKRSTVDKPVDIHSQLASPVIRKSEDTSDVYPLIQPMKSALYFDNADGFGNWRIVISTRAHQDLRRLHKKDIQLFDIVIKKINELSNGHFSKENHKQLTDSSTSAIPIYEAKMTSDTRLVYYIDCVSDFGSDLERQVIRVYGVYTHNELNRQVWSRVGKELARNGKEYQRRCNLRKRPEKKGVHSDFVLPESFPPLEEIPQPLNPMCLPELHQDELKQLHEILGLGKYITLSQGLMNSILADLEVSHVFDVSRSEKSIIEHYGSCYVLGRSGTGYLSNSFPFKTTTMLLKMLGNERLWQARGETCRQMFVTHSRVLAEKVQEYFFNLYDSLAIANKSVYDIRKSVPRREPHHEQTRDLRAEDEDEDGEIVHNSLPRSFKHLKDEHFPLFLTSDQLFRMLENEFGLQDFLTEDTFQPSTMQDREMDRSDQDSNGCMYQRHSGFVSYDVFLDSYWVHFPQSLIKGLDPALVFGEFMGVIRGSEHTLSKPKGYLDLNTYLALSYRTQATFASQRHTIYQLFLAYLKSKRVRREYDAADRTHAIIRAMQTRRLQGKVDYIYVDEVQDNLLIDTLVLRMICTNPKTGLFWAGDTAQTISVGSSFRFNDLKAFMYRIETNSARHLSEAPSKPTSFQLAVNYRSHAGIVDCAYSVIELITRFWPHSIDTMAPEQGIVQGVKPIFFSRWDTGLASPEQLLFGNPGNSTPIEFGHEQCILVRDEAARNRLVAQVGRTDIGIVMTLYESKGLEFNDVLLYDFFADSAVDYSQWRVVLNACPEGQLVHHKAPEFDENRHSSVCRELKLLYVAITRARQNIWIADSSDRGEPMRAIWTAKGLIHSPKLGRDVSLASTSSTPEEWAKKASELYDNMNYEQAAYCYQRARMPRHMRVARACYLRKQAKRIPQLSLNSGSSERKTAFTKAAEAFLECACEAVSIDGKLDYLGHAAKCYERAGDYKNAGQTYYDAKKYTASAQCFRRGGLFDEAIDVVQNHEVDKSTAETIIDVSRLEFLRQYKIEKANTLFRSEEEMLDYMEGCGLDITRAKFLENLGRLAEAAEIYLQENRILDAIAILLKDQRNPRSLCRASRCLVDSLWRSLPFGASPRSQAATTDRILQGLLKYLTEVKYSNQGHDDQLMDEIFMFKAIVASDVDTLLRLGERFQCRYDDNAASLLCLDHAFAALPNLKDISSHKLSATLHNFLLYAQLVQKFLHDLLPRRSPAVQRLFGFDIITEELISIHQNNLSLYTQRNSHHILTGRWKENLFITDRWRIEKLLRELLCSRLLEQVKAENDRCRQSRAFQLCLNLYVFGLCNRIDCPHLHGNPSECNITAYNLRIRLHIQQILVYHTIYNLEHPIARGRTHRYWLRRLHEVLVPPVYILGSSHKLRANLIPELTNAMRVIKTWSVNELYHLRPYYKDDNNNRIPDPNFLPSIMSLLGLIMTGGSSTLDAYISRAPCFNAWRQDLLMRNADDVGNTNSEHKCYVVEDLLSFLQLNHSSSLTQGILFSRHVIANRVPLDIAVFCNLLDNVSASLIVARFLCGRGTLHNVTLPLSWLVNLGDRLSRYEKLETSQLDEYIVSMAQLLERMFTGDVSMKDHLSFEGCGLSTLPRKRNIFIARVCRNLCLLGFNLRWLQGKILEIVTSIYKPEVHYSFIIRSYVTANSWNDLALAARRPVTNRFPIDEMVQLHAANLTSSSVPTISNVQRITYRNIEELPSLLKQSGTTPQPAQLLYQKLGPVHAHIPLRNSDDLETIHDVEDEGNEEDVQQPVDDFERGMPRAGADNQGAGLNVRESDQAEAAITEGLSEEEVLAAHTILLAYRRYVRRRESTQDSRIGTMRRRIIASFHEASPAMVWPFKYYKMLYLGYIPHLVVCLEHARDHLHAEKDKVKKRLKVVHHLELEQIRGHQTEISKLFRKAISLHKELNHDSELHRKRDLETLTACAVQVQELLCKLPARAMQECEGDLAIAIRGIVAPKVPPKAKKSKPVLNLGDDLDMEFII